MRNILYLANSPTDRGQGLNHAICDASNFVAALQAVTSASSSLKEAITAYNDEVVKRGGEEVSISRQTALDLLNWDQLMESPVMKKSLGRTDIPTEAADAKPEATAETK